MILNFQYKKTWIYAVLIIVVICYLGIEAQGNGDFLIFLTAAGKLSNQFNIYENKYLTDYCYYYSLLFALLLKPFYALPFFIVKFLWLALNSALAAHLFYLLTKIEALNLIPKKEKNIFFIVVFLFSIRFLHENIHASQITILLLWLSIIGLKLIASNKPIKGATLLALGINIKLFPLVFLPYLIYRGYFKAFGFIVLFYVVSLWLPSLYLGTETNLTYLKSWWLLVNPQQAQHIFDVDERSFHGLSTLLTTLLIENPPDPLAMQLKRNIVSLTESQFKYILFFSRIILIAITLYFLRLKFFVKAKTQLHQFYEIAYILLLIPIIFPHQQHYGFLFIVPAFVVCLFYLIQNYLHDKKLNFTLGIILLISFLLCTLKLWLGEFNNYYEHFKILSYGALLLVSTMVYSFKINSIKN